MTINIPDLEAKAKAVPETSFWETVIVNRLYAAPDANTDWAKACNPATILALCSELRACYARFKRIAEDYMDIDEMDDDEADSVGLDRSELVEMAYDNLQCEAKAALERLKAMGLV